MKILQVLAVALCLSIGYAMPAMSASEEAPVNAELTKMKHPAMRHHRSMSKAMMKELNLNTEQKSQWDALANQKKKELRPIREQMRKLQEQERKINEKYDDKIKKLLNQEQKSKYKSMLSQKPDAPKKRHGKKQQPKKD